METTFHHQSSPSEPRNPAVVSPCAACKVLRRRCTGKCALAPYFPPTELLEFMIAHRVFGASNIIKLLQAIPLPRQTHTRTHTQCTNTNYATLFFNSRISKVFNEIVVTPWITDNLLKFSIIKNTAIFRYLYMHDIKSLTFCTCSPQHFCDAPIRRVRRRHCNVYTQVRNTLTYIR